MSRQFRSDDTSAWPYKFGFGSNGAKVFSSSKTLDATDFFFNGSLTGTSGNSTGTTTITAGTYNLPCVIIQTQDISGNGANAGKWELNFLSTVVGSTANLTLPLTNNYTAGAQIITGGQWGPLTINSGINLSTPAWNGISGGIGLLFSNNILTNNSTIHGDGVGFRGGPGHIDTGTAQTGRWGESINQAYNTGYYQKDSGSPFAVGVASPGYAGGGANPVLDGDGGGAGGGHATSGQSTLGNGQGGTTYDTSTNTVVNLGAGGGGGRSSGTGGNGGIGGGIWFIFANNFNNLGTLTVAGVNGTIGSDSSGGTSGGAGAGGYAVVKANIATVGTIVGPGGAGIAGSGGTTFSGGGFAGNGFLTLDYNTLLSGSTTGITTRQDSSLVNFSSGGSFLLNFI